MCQEKSKEKYLDTSQTANTSSIYKSTMPNKQNPIGHRPTTLFGGMLNCHINTIAKTNPHRVFTPSKGQNFLK